MKDIANCGYKLYWHNCYSGTYNLIHPDSISHPAKMSPTLCFRILQHLQELGLLKEGDTILDPMSGTGITNICAGAMGYPSISVELEEKFVNFEKQNKDYAERRLYKSLDWQMIQGDSRQLSDLLKGQNLKSVVSPPYAGREEHRLGYPHHEKDEERGHQPYLGYREGYGDNPDNIGNLKDTPLKSITSPPYQDSQGHPSLGSVNKDDWGKEGKDIVKRRGLSGEYGSSDGQVGNLKSITSPPYGHPASGEDKTAEETRILRRTQGGGLGQSLRQPNGYGEGIDNIGNLKDIPLKAITSPPYGDAEKRDRSKEVSNEKEKDYPRGDHNISAGYQGSPYNIGKLDDKPLKSVTSPPYAGGTGHGGTPTELDEQKHITDWVKEQYGQSEGQIENLPDKPLKSVMSPPYEGGGHHKGMLDSWGGKNTPVSQKSKDDHGYGSTKGQIEDAESYLEAMLKVYSEIARVSDVLTVVVKNPTRNGKLRRLDLDTIKILEMSGWNIHCQHRALLFEELQQTVMINKTDILTVDLSRAVEQPTFGYKTFITPSVDVDNGIIKFQDLQKIYPNLKPNTLYYCPLIPEGESEIGGKSVKGRLSFFKRLSWQNGQPVASWEDILVCTRR